MKNLGYNHETLLWKIEVSQRRAMMRGEVERPAMADPVDTPTPEKSPDPLSLQSVMAMAPQLFGN